MPDISMCRNELCVMKELCFRYTATPKELYQYYSNFIPKDNTEVDFECEKFEPNRNRNNG